MGDDITSELASFCAAALGIAANSACGFNEWARAGTQEHVLHSAMAARSGVESVLLTAEFPARNGSRVEVLLDDGRTLVAEQDTFPSMTAEAIVRRFHLAADPIYGRLASQTILDHIDGLGQAPSAAGLLRALQVC